MGRGFDGLRAKVQTVLAFRNCFRSHSFASLLRGGAPWFRAAPADTGLTNLDGCTHLLSLFRVVERPHRSRAICRNSSGDRAGCGLVFRRQNRFRFRCSIKRLETDPQPIGVSAFNQGKHRGLAPARNSRKRHNTTEAFSLLNGSCTVTRVTERVLQIDVLYNLKGRVRLAARR